MNRDSGSKSGGGDSKDSRRRGGGRSPSRSSRHSRRRSRSRDRGGRSGGGGGASKSEEQQRLREMLLSEAAKRNPDAAQVLQNTSGGAADQESLQRALQTASSLSASQHQQQQQQLQELKNQQYQQHRQQGGHHHHSSSDRGGSNNNPRGDQSNRQADPDKVLKELHIGALPDQMSDELEFTRFLNDVCIQKRIATEPGNPVLSTRINPVGHFAFAMFRNKEEATRAMDLNGVVCFGNALRVDRPKGYKERMGGGGGGDRPSFHHQQSQGGDETAMILSQVPMPNIPGFTREGLRNRLEASLARYGDPTSLVQLSNLPQASLDDIDSEARRFGMVQGVKPAPDQDGVFLVKMGTIQDAEKLVQIKRAFKNQRVHACFRPLVEWTALQQQ